MAAKDEGDPAPAPVQLAAPAPGTVPDPVVIPVPAELQHALAEATGIDKRFVAVKLEQVETNIEQVETFGNRKSKKRKRGEMEEEPDPEVSMEEGLSRMTYRP